MLNHSQRHSNRKKTKFKLPNLKMPSNLLIFLQLKRLRQTQIWPKRRRLLVCSNVLIRQLSPKLAYPQRLIFPRMQSATCIHFQCSSDSEATMIFRLQTPTKFQMSKNCTLMLKKMKKTKTKITKTVSTSSLNGGWNRMPSPRKSHSWRKKSKPQKKLSRSATYGH